MNNSSVTGITKTNIPKSSKELFNELRSLPNEGFDFENNHNMAFERTLPIKDQYFSLFNAEEVLEAENDFTKLLMYGNTYDLLNLYKTKLKPILLSSHNKQSLENMKCKASIFLSIISRKLIKSGISPDIAMGYEDVYIEIIYHAKTSQELLSTIEKLIVYSSSLVTQLNNIEHINIISKVSKYVNDHISEPISLKAVAKHVGLSVNYFSSLFKKELNTSFTSYVNECRINKSKELLKNTDHSLANIATEVGFKNQNYFTTIFKKYTTVTPRQYREKNSITFK